MSLTASMIVRNEEAMLPRCLESLRGIDEIVILDTGSTDGTAAAAAAAHLSGLPVRFIPNAYQWHDDFSHARNFCLDFCPEDWILTIDADEYLEPGGLETVMNACRAAGSGIQAFSLKCQAHGGIAWHRSPRVYRNLPAHRWRGAAHNTQNIPRAEVLPVVLRYDHSPAHAADPRRTIRILTKTVSEQPDDARTLYYLGSEHQRKGEHETAAHYLERCLQTSTFYYHAEAWLLLARCLWQMRQGEAARAACFKAIERNANFKEAILFMAEMSFEKNAKVWREMAAHATNEEVMFVRTE